MKKKLKIIRQEKPSKFVETEVEYLRRLVLDLTMKLSLLASENRTGVSQMSLVPQDPIAVAIQKSQLMAALTEEEKKQKEEAPRQINQILGVE
jgi:hypothetical protein